jgi:hypothetical protein
VHAVKEMHRARNSRRHCVDAMEILATTVAECTDFHRSMEGCGDFRDLFGGCIGSNLGIGISKIKSNLV